MMGASTAGAEPPNDAGAVYPLCGCPDCQHILAEHRARMLAGCEAPERGSAA